MEDSLAGELLMFVFTLGEIRSSSTTNKPLYTLLKMSEKPLLFYFFSGYRNEALAWDELILTNHISHLAAPWSWFIEGVDENLMLTFPTACVSENCIKIKN